MRARVSQLSGHIILIIVIPCMHAYETCTIGQLRMMLLHAMQAPRDDQCYIELQYCHTIHA